MDRKRYLELVESMANLLATAFPGAEESDRRADMLNAFEQALVSEVSEPSAMGNGALRVSLLGRFAVQSTDQVVDERHWPTQKAMLLFAFLASRGNRPVPDSLVVGTFWPDSSEDRARSSLRNALHHARTTLAPLTGERELLERNRRSRTVTLQVPCILDSNLFESSIHEGTELYQQGRTAEALEHLKAAMELYRGEFLEGFLDEWVLGFRAHYAELHLRGLHLLARCHLAQADVGAAEQVARYAVTLDSLREDLHADLIEALVAQGRRGEAIRHYRETVDLFEREMGVVPSTLLEIHEALLAEGASRVDSAAPTSAMGIIARDRLRAARPRSADRPRLSLVAS